MIMEGWIKLHRKILDHWLYTEHRPLTRREAWETILMTVNYEPNKMLIKGKVYECDSGQSLLSLDSWSKKFNWSIQQVRTFFKLLEIDGMITTEGLQYTTRLTVCNWELYQQEATDEKHTANRPLTDRQQTANRPLTTIKEREEYKEIKEIKNNNKYDFKKSLLDLGVRDNVADDWLIVRKQKKAANTETAFNAIKKQIEISGLTANECIKLAVEKSWSGFNAEWVNNLNQKQNGHSKSNHRANADERKQQRDAEFAAHIAAKLNSNNKSGSGDVPLPF